METLTIASLAAQVRGVSYKPEDLHGSLDDSSVILLRANNIDDGKINFDDVVFVDKKRVSNEQFLRKGDILVCASSGSKNLVGKAASVDFDKEVTFGAFCKVVRPCNIEDAEYLAMFFQSPIYRRQIAATAIGANINNIRNEHIDTISVKWPATVKRKEIVDILSKAEAIIRKRKKQLSALDDLIKARFVEMFGDPLNGTAKWPFHSVGDVAESVDPQPSHRTPPVDADGIPYVSIKDCDYKTGKINFDGARKVSRSVLEEHRNRYSLHDGDFIIGKIGTIGNPIFVPARDDYTLSANIVLIQPKQGKVSPYYLMYSFMSAYMDRQFEEAKNSTSQAAFGIQKVRQIKVMNPELKEQYRFEEFARQIDKSKSAIQKSLDETQLLFDSLMQKYFG